MSKLQKVLHKIYPEGGAGDLAGVLSGLHKKVVFTNGCFDILHRGHIDYLAKAADLGDILVLGLNTDKSVSSIKGAHRPINDETGRAQVLASLSFVDYVILFGEDTPLRLIETLQPDVLVKGSDYEIKDIVGAEIVLAKGGKVITLDYLEGYSTTAIEERIHKAANKR